MNMIGELAPERSRQDARDRLEALVQSVRAMGLCLGQCQHDGIRQLVVCAKKPNGKIQRVALVFDLLITKGRQVHLNSELRFAKAEPLDDDMGLWMPAQDAMHHVLRAIKKLQLL